MMPRVFRLVLVASAGVAVGWIISTQIAPDAHPLSTIGTPLLPRDEWDAFLPMRGVDLGEVVAGAVYGADYHFRNAGDAPVMVYDLTASCGCIFTTIKDVIILPGEDLRVPVEVIPKDVMGPFLFTIWIRSDDARIDGMSFDIRGDVVGRLQVIDDEQAIEIDNETGETIRLIAWLESKRDQAPELNEAVAIASTNGSLEIQSLEFYVTKNHSDYMIEAFLLIDPTALTGEYQLELEVPITNYGSGLLRLERRVMLR